MKEKWVIKKDLYMVMVFEDRPNQESYLFKVIDEVSENNNPNLYVYGNNRQNTCEDIINLLNRNIVPEWIGKAYKTKQEAFSVYIYGRSNEIRAGGPFHDIGLPNNNFVEKEEDDSLRQKLINRFIDYNRKR